MAEQHPLTAVIDEGSMDSSDGHAIHWAIAGNPAGKPAVLGTNTTAHLIADIEQLRTLLGDNLALAYNRLLMDPDPSIAGGFQRNPRFDDPEFRLTTPRHQRPGRRGLRTRISLLRR